MLLHHIQLFDAFDLRRCRFFSFMLLLFAVHQMALCLFRMLASIARDITTANTFASLSLLVVFLLGGFILPKGSVAIWCTKLFTLCGFHYVIARECANFSLETECYIHISFWQFVPIFLDMVKPWWLWTLYISPLLYGQRSLSVNEFDAPRWMKVCTWT